MAQEQIEAMVKDLVRGLRVLRVLVAWGRAVAVWQSGLTGVGWAQRRGGPVAEERALRP